MVYGTVDNFDAYIFHQSVFVGIFICKLQVPHCTPRGHLLWCMVPPSLDPSLPCPFQQAFLGEWQTSARKMQGQGLASLQWRLRQAKDQQMIPMEIFVIFNVY